MIFPPFSGQTKGVKPIVLPHLRITPWFVHNIHIAYATTTWLVFRLFSLFWCSLLLCCCCCCCYFIFKNSKQGSWYWFFKVPQTISYKNFFLALHSSHSATPLQLPGSAFCSYEKVSLTVLIYKGALTQISYSEVWFYRMQFLPNLS